MIAGIFHQGSGLGDQLFRYITTRTLALDKGLEFGMIYPENFKGKEFMKLDMGKDPMLTRTAMWKWGEKDVRENGMDIRSYDPEINFVEDNTIIDGNFEDIKYWGHRLPEIQEWLKVEPLEMPDDLCVINFRGGEYSTVPELFLDRGYWLNGILRMKQVNVNMSFEVHTDDLILAKQFFGFPVIKDIALNWRSIRHAKHLILSNSAFGILPALLNENAEEVIAPRGWARHNLKNGIWARPSCYYKKFNYI